MKCLWCNSELPESKGKPFKFCGANCKMSYRRNSIGEKSNKITEKSNAAVEKSNSTRVFSEKQRADLLKQKKRACWVDVFEYPDMTYAESVIHYLGDSPNSIYAKAAMENKEDMF